MKTVFSITLFIFLSLPVFSRLQLPALFCDNMVLQREFEAPFWGWAEPGEIVAVKGSWNNIAVMTITDDHGKWMLKLPTPEAGGPYFVTINNDTLKNVMIGEVWICSGQSNMQFALSDTQDSATKAEIENAVLPELRLFYVARDNADEPNDNCYGRWEECTPESAGSFSAVAYYFGKEIQQRLKIPVGLIHVSWGGSSAQAWVNYNVLKNTPEGRYYIEKYRNKVASVRPGINPRDQQSPASLYNGMLKPLIPYGIRGAIWYQGEANTKEHALYAGLMNTMITDWRGEWGEGDFPFYFVQIAPFDYDDQIVGAALRDAQRRTLAVPNTGMAVTLDIGNPDDVHPKNKKDVGHRLALWARAKTYGESDLVYSGPLYRSMKTEKNKIRLYFDHTGSGLICTGEKPTCFEIAGEDKVFYPADAQIDGNTVVVFSKKVKNPVAVRFAFHNGDEPNLFNREGLPASTFRTDDWKIITAKAPVTGKFDEDQKALIISIEPEEGWDIRYTTDGSEPGMESKKYTAPFVLTEDAVVRSRVFVDHNPSLLTSELRIEKHLATGKKVYYNEQYAERYSGGGDFALVNSMFGSQNFRDGKWQGFSGKNLDVIIDLEQPETISSVGVNCLQVVNSWIVFPVEIDVFVSDDGEHFTPIASLKNVIPVKPNQKEIHLFQSRFDPVKTQYVRVVAKNYGKLPLWHKGVGYNAWLFADEIIIK
jgi:sialate O-acetylesterase